MLVNPGHVINRKFSLEEMTENIFRKTYLLLLDKFVWGEMWAEPDLLTPLSSCALPGCGGGAAELQISGVHLRAPGSGQLASADRVSPNRDPKSTGTCFLPTDLPPSSVPEVSPLRQIQEAVPL